MELMIDDKWDKESWEHSSCDKASIYKWGFRHGIVYCKDLQRQ